MDEPSRAPRPADRVAAASDMRHRPEAPLRPAVSQHNTTKGKKSKKRLITTILIVVAVAVLVAAGWFGWSRMRGNGIDGGKYQAVFLANGQVYFGKLQIFGGDFLKLTDVFYVQSGSAAAVTNTNKDEDNSSMSLVKLGGEVHGPEDEMIINRDQVLFYENLKSDGKVADLITKYHANNK